MNIIKGHLPEAVKSAGIKREPDGIGTYKEKTLHSAVKFLLEPDVTCHEIRHGKLIADIENEHGIIEIQTRSFNNMRSKLEFFLKDKTVTIVYPYASVKWLMWLDPETGEISKKRKSPRKMSFFDAFYELYKIRAFLLEPNLNILLLGLELEETRLLTGWSDDRKKGSARFDRYPVSIKESLHLKTPEDYIWLIPANIPSPFTASDYAEYAKVSSRTAYSAISCLKELGVIRKIGKENRRNLYEVI